jgi:hypothetical protein
MGRSMEPWTTSSSPKRPSRTVTLRYAEAPAGKVAIENASIEFPVGRLTIVSGPTGDGAVDHLELAQEAKQDCGNRKRRTLSVR